MTNVDTMRPHPAADIFPMLTEPELRELADDIRKNGLIDPVWVYDDPNLGWCILDGRNRAAACKLAGVTPRQQVYEGADPIGFAVSTNVRRRHLTTGQRDMLGLRVIGLYEEETRRRQVEAVKRSHTSGARENLVVADRPQLGTPPPAPEPTPTPVRGPLSRDLAAAAVGASGRGVAKAKRITENAPDLADKVANGTLAIDRAERILRDRDAEQRRIEQAQRDQQLLDIKPTTTLHHGDFRETLNNLRDVDAIITDPPYPAEYLPLLVDLAQWADRVLKPDGVLVILMGQTHLPDVYRLLEGGRPYRWTGCYLTPGLGYASHPRRLQSNWKPLLVYGAGPRFADTIRSEATDADAKNYHEWGQDYGAFHTLIERFTQRGQLVADPFAGSGTTLLAAQAQGRNSVGAELDADHYQTAKRRLGI